MRTRIGCHPWLFNAAFRAFNRDASRLVNRQTDIVIEGFPRSANSFAVAAFSWSQSAEGRTPVIANHVHAPSQILKGLELGKPVCLLLRPPEAAVPALLEKVPQFRAGDLLRAYRLYYRTLLPYRDRIVVAPFDLVTRDFGAVIEALNRRFDRAYTAVSAQDHRAYSERFLALDKLHRATVPLPYVQAGQGTRPRSEDKLEPGLLEDCQACYRALIAKD